MCNDTMTVLLCDGTSRYREPVAPFWLFQAGGKFCEDRLKACGFSAGTRRVSKNSLVISVVLCGVYIG